MREQGERLVAVDKRPSSISSCLCLGIRMYRQLMSGRMTRMSFYRKIVLMEWCLAATVCIVFAVGGIPLKFLYTSPVGMGSSHGMTEDWLAGIVVGSLAGGIGFAAQSNLRHQHGRDRRRDVRGFRYSTRISRMERNPCSRSFRGSFDVWICPNRNAMDSDNNSHDH